MTHTLYIYSNTNFGYVNLIQDYVLCIGESPSICPFLKNNEHEVSKGPSAIIFQEWTDARIFSYLKYTLI